MVSNRIRHRKRSRFKTRSHWPSDGRNGAARYFRARHRVPGRCAHGTRSRVAARTGEKAVSAGSRSEEAAVTFDFANWPLLDLIDVRTNVAVFFRSGVPAELRVAALRRAWMAD